MNTYIKSVFAISLIAMVSIFLSGCNTAVETKEVKWPRAVEKLTDVKTGVVCYTYYQNSISCVKVY